LAEQGPDVVVVTVRALPFFAPAERLFLILHGDEGAHHFRHTLAAVINDVESDTQVGRLVTLITGSTVMRTLAAQAWKHHIILD
jgi:hypothetical protein